MNELDKRRFRRFVVPLKMEVHQRAQNGFLGTVKDFSRFGIRAVFGNFDIEPNAAVEFKIEKPNKNISVDARGEVMWKRYVEGKWDVGIRLTDFPPDDKIDILDYAYTKWVKTLGFPTHN